MSFAAYKKCSDTLATYAALAACAFESGKIKGVALIDGDMDVDAFVDSSTTALIAAATNWIADNGVQKVIGDVRGTVPEITENTFNDLNEVPHLVDRTFVVTFEVEGVDANMDFWNQISHSRNKYAMAFIYEDNKSWWPLKSIDATNSEVVPCSFMARPISTGNNANDTRRTQVTVTWRTKDLPYSFSAPVDLL